MRRGKAGIELLRRHRRHRGEGRRWTLGGDKSYDTAEFVHDCRGLEVTPHIACNTGGGRRSRVDQRTTRHEGYLVSQRKRVEEIFGWVKTVGGGRKLRYIGLTKNAILATLTATAYNLVRMANWSWLQRVRRPPMRPRARSKRPRKECSTP